MGGEIGIDLATTGGTGFMLEGGAVGAIALMSSIFGVGFAGSIAGRCGSNFAGEDAAGLICTGIPPIVS